MDKTRLYQGDTSDALDSSDYIQPMPDQRESTGYLHPIQGQGQTTVQPQPLEGQGQKSDFLHPIQGQGQGSGYLHPTQGQGQSSGNIQGQGQSSDHLQSIQGQGQDSNYLHPIQGRSSEVIQASDRTSQRYAGLYLDLNDENVYDELAQPPPYTEVAPPPPHQTVAGSHGAPMNGPFVTNRSGAVSWNTGVQGQGQLVPGAPPQQSIVVIHQHYHGGCCTCLLALAILVTIFGIIVLPLGIISIVLAVMAGQKTRTQAADEKVFNRAAIIMVLITLAGAILTYTLLAVV